MGCSSLRVFLTLAGLANDKLVSYLTKKNNRIREPEFRLRPLLLSCALTPAAMRTLVRGGRVTISPRRRHGRKHDPDPDLFYRVLRYREQLSRHDLAQLFPTCCGVAICSIGERVGMFRALVPCVCSLWVYGCRDSCIYERGSRKRI
ncbi:uncharacterized protein V1513DRAFT_443465 [Lipomyces chichibuensis]|uniref:uncharacterized protein n=1 Tax=Lipomyces chichibuensis TaxID=1546026 RepID=UPI0033430E6B